MGLYTPSTQDQNPMVDTARACIVYSLVPYLGIVFIPPALAISGFGYLRSERKHTDDRHRFIFSAALSLAVLAVQIFLWWLLYFIPKLGV